MLWETILCSLSTISSCFHLSTFASWLGISLSQSSSYYVSSAAVVTVHPSLLMLKPLFLLKNLITLYVVRMWTLFCSGSHSPRFFPTLHFSILDIQCLSFSSVLSHLSELIPFSYDCMPINSALYFLPLSFHYASTLENQYLDNLDTSYSANSGCLL